VKLGLMLVSFESPYLSVEVILLSRAVLSQFDRILRKNVIFARAFTSALSKYRSRSRGSPTTLNKTRRVNLSNEPRTKAVRSTVRPQSVRLMCVACTHTRTLRRHKPIKCKCEIAYHRVALHLLIELYCNKIFFKCSFHFIQQAHYSRASKPIR